MQKGKLTFYCAKMGAGKSTHSIVLSKEKSCVLVSEDEWLSQLYPNKILNIQDYVHYSNLLKPVIKKLVQSILVSGCDVIMDFPANTKKQRDWFKSIFSEIEVEHELIYIDVSNEQCLTQIEKRRLENPDRATTDTKEMFDVMLKYFEPIESVENFNVVKV